MHSFKVIVGGGAQNTRVALPPHLLQVSRHRFCTVRTDALAFLLDALHGMLSLHYMLTQAEFVRALPVEDLVEVNGHHKEASAEVFFSLSMTADCMPGSVVQYVHKFAYLFHSISQVVYYNFPTYNRQRQLPLEKLQEANAPDINLLPLLTELRPDIPVLCEHTGAGHRATHAQHKWSWVLWTQYVFLVDGEMKVYVATCARCCTWRSESSVFFVNTFICADTHRS